MYIPDNWILMDTGQAVKVLAGWKGGYLHGDEWRLSSGVTKIEDCEEYWKITNVSGSTYHCYKHREGMSTVMTGIYDSIMYMEGKKVSIAEFFGEKNVHKY